MEHAKPTTPDGSPLRLIHASAPQGCRSETTSTVETAAGPVTIRVRRITERHYVGGRGYQWGDRVEVAVRTPHTSAEGLGFVDVDGQFLWAVGEADGVASLEPSYGRTPEHDLAVHIHFGAQLAEVAEKRVRRRAADRAPMRTDRGADGSREPKPRTSPRVPAVGKEALRRLLHVRGAQYERHTGADWTAERHRRCYELTGSESSRGLSYDALSVLVDDLTADLEAAGFDVEAADAVYAARQSGQARTGAPHRRAA